MQRSHSLFFLLPSIKEVTFSRKDLFNMRGNIVGKSFQFAADRVISKLLILVAKG